MICERGAKMNLNFNIKVTLVLFLIFTCITSLSPKEELCLNNKELLVEETNDSIAAAIENDSLAAVIENHSHRNKTLEQVSKKKITHGQPLCRTP